MKTKQEGGAFKYSSVKVHKFSYLEKLRTCEWQEDRELVAVAMALISGVVIYFALPFEPSLSLTIILAVPFIGILLRFGASNRLLQEGAILALALIIGLAAATFHASRVTAPILPDSERFYVLEGTVDLFEVNDEGGKRLIISGPVIDKLDVDKTPKRLSMMVRTDVPDDLAVGERVALSAMLAAPSGPVYPGGFNFARKAWFDQIGGMGFATSAVVPVGEGAESADIGFWEARRPIIRAHVSDHVSNPAAKGLATALLSGDRSLIPDDVARAMRDAGLAHVLAISGLHMGLVTATIFFMIEACLALFPSIALRVAPAKLAAVVAWCGALAYLFLSGGAVSTVRAFIMVSVALVAVLIDRKAFSLRSVAIAAIFIVLVQPNAVISVGFQMSFAAVAALVVVYNRYGLTLIYGKAIKKEGGLKWFHKLGGVMIASIITTLVAELAIAPFALYHFQNIVLYGVLANMIVIPIISFCVMPLLLLSLILMPFGLDWMILPLVEIGLNIVVDTALWVSALPGATGHIPAMEPKFLIVAMVGFLSWVIIRSWQGVATMAVAASLMLLFAGLQQPPKGYISKAGNVFALTQSNTNLAFNTARHSYAKENWQRASGEKPISKGRMPLLEKSCDSVSCLYVDDAGLTIAQAKTYAALMQDCGRVDIIIAPELTGTACKGSTLVVDWRVLADGPLAIVQSETGVVTLLKTKEKGRVRPWLSD